MGKHTAIEWAHHTFNPWWGCVEPSPACDNCYAREFAKRLGFDIWGKDKPRRFFSDAHWREPLKWNAAAKAAGVRERVFCASMGDVLERRLDLKAPRARLWALIDECDSLDWLLLTKRAGNFKTMVPSAWMQPGHWPANVWPGVTVENLQQLQLRVPELCKLPSLQKFLSMEPLLEDVAGPPGSRERELFTTFLVSGFDTPPYTDVITWLIGGGESGNLARPSHPDWFRHLRDAARACGVAFNFKQWGQWAQHAKYLRGEDGPWDTYINVDGTGGQCAISSMDEETWTNWTGPGPVGDNTAIISRVKKKEDAGRLLDGREWNDVPAPRTWAEVA